MIILLIKNISHDANDAYDQECVFKKVDHYGHTNNFRILFPYRENIPISYTPIVSQYNSEICGGGGGEGGVVGALGRTKG